jgi:hypothetical protein
MGTRSVEANQGITSTIEHAITAIVHHLSPAEAAFEMVPLRCVSDGINILASKGLSLS